MGLFLKQSTTPTVKIGPFLDETNGKDAENGLTLTQADIRLSKNGGNFAQKTEANNATIDELGYYDCPLDATDTGTLGRLQLAVHEAGALPVYHEYMIVTANVYDTLCSTDTLQADLTQIGGVAQSATDLKDFADAGYDPATNKLQGLVLCDLTTTTTTATAATDVTNDVGITQAGADKVWGTAARALTDKAGFSLAADQSAVTVGTVTTITNDVGITQAGADKVWATAARTLTDKTGFSLSAGGIDAIWDEVIEGAYTGRQTLRLNLAVLAGKSSGGGTATLIFKDTSGATDRVTATVDANGNRTGMTLDVT